MVQRAGQVLACVTSGPFAIPKNRSVGGFLHVREAAMETCDHCGPAVRATWRATHGFDQITMCAHCTSKHRLALMDKGWLICVLPSESTAKAHR